jgi:predicted dehydrogenase
METPKRVRIGVIGAGWFASRRHCPEVKERPDAVLAAFARRDYEKLKKMAAHFGVGPWTASLSARRMRSITSM